MTGHPLPPGHTRQLPDDEPAATAEQTIADLLALVAVYEAKPIAYQWIRPSVIREYIEGRAAS